MTAPTPQRDGRSGRVAGSGAVPPGQMTKWLYKSVLHSDLDDPHLGLGEFLFARYPFAKEESRKGG